MDSLYTILVEAYFGTGIKYFPTDSRDLYCKLGYIWACLEILGIKGISSKAYTFDDMVWPVGVTHILGCKSGFFRGKVGILSDGV